MAVHTNEDQLVKLSVLGEISHPTLRKTGYVVNAGGRAEVYPSVGGITYNKRIGDSAIHLMADHVEPGVSIRNTAPSAGEYSPNAGLNVLACIGNRARVVSGDAKGAVGHVTGKHGGIEHVIVNFEPHVLEQLIIGDRIMIQAFGTGLRLLDYEPHIQAMNLSPQLLKKMNLREEEGGILSVGVTHFVPAKIMGAGLGNTSAHSGDYDIQMFDESVVEEYELSGLRFGDIVAILDSDASYGWVYRKNAVTIGVVAHSNSVVSGHGPGVTTILTSPTGKLKPFKDPRANLKNLFPV